MSNVTPIPAPLHDGNVYISKGNCGHERLCEECNNREVYFHDVFQQISSIAEAMVSLLTPRLDAQRARFSEERRKLEAAITLLPSQELELACASAARLRDLAYDETHELLATRFEFINGKNAKLVQGGSIVRYDSEFRPVRKAEKR